MLACWYVGLYQSSLMCRTYRTSDKCTSVLRFFTSTETDRSPFNNMLTQSSFYYTLCIIMNHIFSLKHFILTLSVNKTDQTIQKSDTCTILYESCIHFTPRLIPNTEFTIWLSVSLLFDTWIYLILGI